MLQALASIQFQTWSTASGQVDLGVCYFFLKSSRCWPETQVTGRSRMTTILVCLLVIALWDPIFTSRPAMSAYTGVDWPAGIDCVHLLQVLGIRL